MPVWDAPGGSDAILSGVYGKGMLEHGWFSYFGEWVLLLVEIFRLSTLDTFLLSIIKVIFLFSSEPTHILTIFLIVGFYLVFFSCFGVFRLLSFSVLWSTVAAFVFSLLPFHFFRGFNHLMLSAYFSVPLWVWISLKMYEVSDLRLQDKKALLLIGVFAAIGTMSGVYFALFGMLCVTMSTILNLLKKQNSQAIKIMVSYYHDFINLCVCLCCSKFIFLVWAGAK